MKTVPPLTVSLIVVNTIVFAFTVVRGFLQSTDTIIAAGALVRTNVFQGELWRLGSAVFLHGDIEHLAGNCVGLYILGMATEHAWGFSRSAVIYFAAGLFGSVASVVMSPGPSVGASGAIFGLLGAMIAFFMKHGSHFHIRDKRIGNVLLIWAGYSVVTAYFTPYIDNAAHIGGLVSGAGVTLRLTPRYRVLEKSA